MKRILLFLLVLFSFTASKSEISFYRADAFAYKYVNDYGRWTDWSDWEYSDINISIDYTKAKITIYSSNTQTYYILQYNREYRDTQGGTQVEFKVVDQDGDIGIIRVRRQRDGVAQLYVEFSNVMWVYSGLISN